MDLPGARSIDVADLRHPSFRTALATTVAGTLLLLAIVVVLFVVPYLLLAGW